MLARLRPVLLVFVLLVALVPAGATSSLGVVRPPGQAGEAKAEVRAAMGAKYPELTGVLERLIDDTAHPLNMVTALLDPSTRPRTIALLSQLAAGRTLCGGSLQAFLNAHPGQGPLFRPLAADVNFDANGRSRKLTFLEQAKRADPARRVGAEPTAEERTLVDEYANRLRMQVEPLVSQELGKLSDEINEEFGSGAASFSVRTKTAAGILDKVQRMRDGRSTADDDLGSLTPLGPLPNAQVGDLIDAVGARITVQSTEQLGRLLDRILSYFGTGDHGRIVEVENFYLQPKQRALAYRVIPMAIVVETGGQRYTFELQLTTRRASVAADLNHNTIYKNLIGATPAEQAKVTAAFNEAAAIEQLETRGEQPPGAECGAKTPTTTATPATTTAPAGAFTLVPSLTKVSNPNAVELTITPNAAGQGIDDHTGKNGGAGNGGDWKVEYHWAVPTTLIPGKTAAIYLQIRVDSEQPKQPNGYQMGVLAPNLAQALPCHYPEQSSCSKTFEYPFAADESGANEIVVSVRMLSAEVDFTYRPAGK